LPFAQQDIAEWMRTIDQYRRRWKGHRQYLRHNFTVVRGSPDGMTEVKNKVALKDVSVTTTSSVRATIFPGWICKAGSLCVAITDGVDCVYFEFPSNGISMQSSFQ